MDQIQSFRHQFSLSSTESLFTLGVALSLGIAFFRLTSRSSAKHIQITDKQDQEDQQTMSKHVVILGGGVVGISTAHRLLQNTLPKVKGLKVILVSNSSHAYWNIAAVRAVVPGEIPDEALFQPIAPGFAKYSKSQFEFIVGTATSMDTVGNAVTVETASGPRTIPYQQLVIATGSSISSGLPFKQLSSYEETVAALHALQAQVRAATSIIVAGAGPTGVETIAEIAYKYGATKKITLVIDGEHALPDLLPHIAKTAEAELIKLKVSLIHKARVTGTQDTGDGGKKLTLSTGQTLVTDLFLPLYGVHANASFAPAHILDKSGNIRQQKTLNVVGLDNVWAAGDVGNLEAKTAIKADAQAKHLFANLDTVLTSDKSTGLKEYILDPKIVMGVTLGKKKATGQMGTWKLFSWLIAYMKGRTLLVERLTPMVEGKAVF